MNSKLLFATLAFSSFGPLQADREQAAIHTSTATVQIHYPKDGATSDRFLQNQIVILTAGNTLEEAAKNSGIDRKALAKAIKVRPIKGTDLIYLDATHPGKDKARTIVQSVIDAYANQRTARQANDLGSHLETMDHVIAKQADVVKERRKELTVLIQQYGFPYQENGEDFHQARTEEEMFRRARMKLADFETHRDQLKIQIKQIIETPKKDLVRYAAGLDLPENQVTHYYTKYREAQFDIETKISSGLAKSHPDIVALGNRAKSSLTFAEKEAETLKAVLSTKLELVDRQVDRMSEMVDRRGDDEIDDSLKRHTFNEVKHEYEEARSTLRELKKKQQEAEIHLKAPQKTVTIHGWSHR